LKKYPHEVN